MTTTRSAEPVTTNRVPTVFVLGGGSSGLTLARRCGAMHIDRYASVDPDSVSEGVQASVDNPRLALVFLDSAERIFVYPEFAEVLPLLPRDRVVVIAHGEHPLCKQYSCATEPSCQQQ
jgi:hypothetical protein